MPPWSMISPASRGIGFALARRVLQTTNAPVVATARKDLDKTKEQLLEGLDVDEARLRVLKLDVTDESTIADVAVACKEKFTPGDHQLQLAFFVPGLLFPEKAPAQIDAKDALLTFQTNTLGPMLMIKHFSPFLPKKRAELAKDEEMMKGLPQAASMAIMSARVGSISDNKLGGWYSYRASKAGVNQVVKTFDNYLRTASGDKALALALHPGTVKTEFSKEFWGGVKKEKLFEKEWVAERLVDVVRQVGVDGRGKCWDWDGKEVLP
ncbi:NAD(P)-binding protein [Didymella exigua CBS 183.55]|uniref:NAD(P)-binding protein n=1 Tax=Didymella exigua CBS 183.55 TaxID=1150837 RepID=A0A6A5RVI7_9PLEO|nr:NAD(P)-binding protein [Didymella exigua CBS 183.55]KAF1929327.1 NAD(P)-binding protein [Didymella exigua CBS 183.55]